MHYCIHVFSAACEVCGKVFQSDYRVSVWCWGHSRGALGKTHPVHNSVPTDWRGDIGDVGEYNISVQFSLDCDNSRTWRAFMPSLHVKLMQSLQYGM